MGSITTDRERLEREALSEGWFRTPDGAAAMPDVAARFRGLYTHLRRLEGKVDMLVAATENDALFWYRKTHGGGDGC